ncbi:molecular chaperone GrpE [Alkalithermobacter thermoalcaliphilus JW-YL-7 = DSM 7308]|uniref:Protein GrpE n=1 Tax=Alkalithermobacter thermoalcaliphilus JW-YL-7 = DSM 7308 TaxID=1121328 RepID=A0A150FST1_CLOPD|nr:Protein grpE [[Clostridium] paradoxum JW-YL-7 = DSM 7308]SHL01250.1 molecular chaperone GrpE [[Clostridium] paradoxum JW-YL-7 = DSM 7308]
MVDKEQEQVKEEELKEEVQNKDNESVKQNEENNQLELQVNDLKDSLQRLQADFINYKRRVEKEKGELSVLANEKIITELLPVIDNMERALASCNEQEKSSSIYQGVELVLKQLTDTLQKFGLEEIKAKDEAFNPDVHYAVMHEEVEDKESGIVVEVYQKGYKLSSKVIRPSMVKVSK